MYVLFGISLSLNKEAFCNSVPSVLRTQDVCEIGGFHSSEDVIVGFQSYNAIWTVGR